MPGQLRRDPLKRQTSEKGDHMAAKKKDTILAFKIEDNRYEIDLEDLEFGEVEALEEAFDLPFDEIDLARMKAMRILIYIAMRRKDPRVTMEQVSAFKVTSFEAEDEEQVPTKPVATKKAAKAA